MPALDYEKIARFYDLYVQYQDDIPFYIEELSQISGRVLELTCGTGRISIPLKQEGIKLTCIDSSPAMLRIFKEKLRHVQDGIQLLAADIMQFSLRTQYKAVIFPFHSFGELKSPAEQHAALYRIHQHLIPGGIFICPIHNPVIRSLRCDGDKNHIGTFKMHDGKSSLTVWSEEFYNENTQMVFGTQHYIIHDEHGKQTSHEVADLSFKLLTRIQFEKILNNSGFKINRLYGGYNYEVFDEQASPVLICIAESIE